MRIVLWILQALLAAAFLAAGGMKAFQSNDALVDSMAWVADVPGWLVTFIGVVEIAGALGLILPALTRIAPVLTPLAATGLALTMAIAAVFHLVRAEYTGIIPNVVLFALLGVVAWARFGPHAIEPRTADTA